MTTNNREPGFYWVKYKRKRHRAEFTGNHWWITGIGAIISDSDFTYILPEPIKPPNICTSTFI